MGEQPIWFISPGGRPGAMETVRPQESGGAHPISIPATLIYAMGRMLSGFARS
jgi:hypothetical protein